MPYVSFSLAVWTNAWLAEKATPDDVTDALQAWAPIHHLHAKASVPAALGESIFLQNQANSTAILHALRLLTQGGTEINIQLVLPAPGDVQGMPAGTDFSRAAMEVGEGLIISGNGITTTALVPHYEQEDVIVWTLFSLKSAVAVPSHMSLGEAEWVLKKAISEAADAILRIELLTSQSSAAQARALIQEAVLEKSALSLPDSTPRVLRVLDSATQIEAILLVGSELMGAPAHTLSGNQTLEQTLLPLWSLVRTARIAAAQAIISAAWTA
ncbi:MAG: hypothetical protein ACRCSF_07775 [Mycobacteriaceae bacterium]